MISSKRVVTLGRWVMFGLLASAVAFLPATGAPRGRSSNEQIFLNHVSQGPLMRFYIEDPSLAPEQLQGRFQRLHEVQESAQTAQSVQAAAAPSPSEVADLFNRDGTGLPQNEESIGVCRRNPQYVLGGTNDYRGLLDPQENFTGWHFSSDNGRTVTNEGLLPAIEGIPSGGDPVDVLDSKGRDTCKAFAASLNYEPATGDPNGIGVYKSTPHTLATCPGGSARACWPNRRLVATGDEGHFLDKEWMDVGQSGEAGKVVWVTYSDFDMTDPEVPFTAEIFAVRCDYSLDTCTEPIPISEDDRDVQFSDVTIGPDGRVYVTWSKITGELEGTPQTFIHKIRVAQPGSTTFGPERVIYRERNAIPFGGFLHANDFRVATYPKNSVTRFGSGENRTNRIYVTWDACLRRILGETTCLEPRIKLTYSDNEGRSWTDPKIISKRNDNYFPAIAQDPSNRNILVAYFTNRFDYFHNRQAVELVTIDGRSAKVTNRQQVTRTLNESEADPVLGGFFIGDYIEVFGHRGNAYTHYNMNYRRIAVLGSEKQIPQQDNYLTKTSE